MRKTLVFFTVTVLYSTVVLAQTNISGTYVDQYGMTLILDDGHFKLIQPTPARRGFYSEVLAEGVFEQVDKSLAEFNSLNNPAFEATRSMKVTQRTGPVAADSIELCFSIPYRKSGLKIFVDTTDPYKSFVLNYSAKNNVLYIPGNVKSFFLSVIPEYLPPHTAAGQFYGVVEFSALEAYDVAKNANRIDIEIPALDDAYFEKYYVKGDYVRVMENALIWKGELFVKKK